MKIIGNIVSSDDDRRIKYSGCRILNIRVLFQILGIYYRSARIFLTKHEEYLRMMSLKKIPSFQALSRKSRINDVHAINSKIMKIVVC